MLLNSKEINKEDILDIVKSLGKHHWKKTLANIKVITDHYKYCINYNLDKFICLDLSTHNWMMNYFGCSKSSSKIIKFCKEIGLVECINELYHYFYLTNGKFCIKRSYCKQYNYNTKVHKLLLELYREYNIHTTKKVEEESILDPLYFDALLSNQSYKKNKNLDISSNLHNQYNSKYLTNKEVTLIVNKNNNDLLKDCQQMIRDLNKGYHHSYLNLRLNLNIERSNYSNIVTKISSRLYSNACNKPSHNLDNHKNNNIYKYLESIGMKDPVKFDINGSIHRLSLLLSGEIEASNNGNPNYNLNTTSSQHTVDDIYTQIFNKISTINNIDTSNIPRDLKKLLANRLYFWRSKYNGLAKFHNFLRRNTLSKDYKRIQNIPHIHTIIDSLANLYPSYGSKIFLIESWIMLHTISYICDQYVQKTNYSDSDYRIAVVYDCIYLSKSVVDKLSIDNAEFHHLISYGVRQFLSKKYIKLDNDNNEDELIIKDLLSC